MCPLCSTTLQTNFIDVISIVKGEFLGPNATLEILKDDKAAGTVSIATARHPEDGEDGVIATITFGSMEATPTDTEVDFTLTEVVARDPVGANVSVSSLGSRTILTNPPVDFTAVPQGGIVPATVQFTDTSLLQNKISWGWSFGDGNTSTEQNPQHTYTQAGTYDVFLTITIPEGNRTLTRSGYIQAGPNQVLSLDGSGDHINLSNSKVNVSGLGLPTREITVEAWAKPNSYGAWEGIIGFIQNNGSFEKGFFLGLHSENQFQFGLATTGGGGVTFLTAANTGQYGDDSYLSTGVWYHVAASYDGSMIRLYVNGQEIVYSASQSGDIVYADSWYELGEYKDDNEDYFFDGLLDEIRIWNISRTQADIQSAMGTTLTGNEQGLVGYWNFDDGTANDLSSNGNHGTLQGDAQVIIQDDAQVIIKIQRGTVTLVDQNPSLQWNYKLTHNNGGVTQWSYTGAGITGATTSGNTLAAGWSVQSQSATRVVFTSASPLTSGTLTGFHITGNDGGTGIWQAGSNSGSVDGALPVELSSFTAKLTPDGVRLKWRTESETNNFGFHIYRIETENGEYVRITPTLIKGHGSDATPHDYSFLDDTAEAGSTYWYLIEDVDFAGNTERSDPIVMNLDRILLTSWGEVRQTALHQNYPNPFNPETWIPYQLASDSSVSISIYDVSGRQIRVLNLGVQPTGFYVTREKAAFGNGKNDKGEAVSSGIYIYQMSAGDYHSTKKMLILK